ncbi:MAG: hypothetical protein JWO77_3748 [Ilumatobacteraceae bacterium]|nr:hypothetical protein [Ilumatobacteraceae bacterium]
MAAYDPQERIPQSRRGQRHADPVERALGRSPDETAADIEANEARAEELLEHQPDADTRAQEIEPPPDS